MSREQRLAKKLATWRCEAQMSIEEVLDVDEQPSPEASGALQPQGQRQP